MQLNLKKPIVFFDLEATGLNIGVDRIVEISMHKVHPNGKEETKTFRINPEIPIPAETTAIHGISDEDIADKPVLKEVASQIVAFIKGADLAGFNLIKFDVPMLAEELMRVEQDFDVSKHKIIDVQRIFHKMEQRTLVAAYKFYCNKDLTNAHSAEADTIATYEVYKAQIERYDELENNTEFLHEFTGSPSDNLVDVAGRLVKNKDGVPVFNFGKYKGMAVVEVLKKDPGYYAWMMKGDFPLYTKKKLTELRLGINS